ncbi:MAG TPA: hypothetical protein VGE52_03880, partial [Pirellulales bacterium]
MRLSVAALAGALCLSSSTPGFAQLIQLSPSTPGLVIDASESIGVAVPAEVAAQLQAAQAAAAEGATKPAENESPRLTKLKALTFDRRPSAYLKAWSKELLPPEPPEPVVAPPTPSAPPAAPAPAPPPADETAEAKAAREKAEAEAKAAMEKEEAEAKAAKEKAEKAAAEEKALTEELTRFQTNVTLGRWDEVKKYLAGLPEAEQKAGYAQLLASLSSGPPDGMGSWPQETNVFSLDDLAGLARSAPSKLELEAIEKLAAVLATALRQELVIDVALVRLREEAAKADAPLFTRRQTAQLLSAAGQAEFAGEFLPTLDEAIAARDDEALNLLTRHFEALYSAKSKTAFLEQAWRANQAVLAVAEGERKEKKTALTRAVELAPRMRKELGQTWLEESFTKQPERGIEILATLGGEIAMGFANHPRDPDYRRRALELQKTAIDALVKANPERAAAWRPTLTLLADHWLREAAYSRDMDTSTSLGPRMNRDGYGNL